ncbi:MAG: hypothetical protein AAB420_00865 [Patescibacteria group bacterium]
MNTLYLILHIIGIALGAGGAFMSDALFFHFLKKRDFSDSNVAILKLGSRMVWIGLAVLLISGVFLFAGNPDRYLHSSKFLIKMTIVLVIAINGVVFHKVHMRRMSEFTPGLFVSGAISMPSWILAIVLGAMHGIALSYPTLLAGYIVILSGSIFVSLMMRKRLPPHDGS